MKRAVVFDFDGTIVDSFDSVFSFLWAHSGKSYEPDSEEINSYRRISMRKMGFKMGIPWWRMLFLYFKGRRQLRASMDHLEPFKGMLEQLEILRQAGCVLFIISSNSRRNIHRFLRGHDLSHQFRAVYAGTTVFGKHQMFRRLILHHHLKNHDNWAVGDQARDAAAAASVDMQTIAVTWGFDSHSRLERAADHIVSAPAEISRIILADTATM